MRARIYAISHPAETHITRIECAYIQVENGVLSVLAEFENELFTVRAYAPGQWGVVRFEGFAEEE